MASVNVTAASINITTTSSGMGMYNVSVDVSATVLKPTGATVLTVTAQLLKCASAYPNNPTVLPATTPPVTLNPVLGMPDQFSRTIPVPSPQLSPGELIFALVHADATTPSADDERSAPKTVPNP